MKSIFEVVFIVRVWDDVDKFMFKSGCGYLVVCVILKLIMGFD